MIRCQKIRAVPVSPIALRLQKNFSFLASFLTPSEIRYCRKNRHPAESAAARLAAKKALFSALKVPAFRQKFWLTKIEVRKSSSGKPLLAIPSAFKKEFRFKPQGEWLVTLAHERTLAIAWVAYVPKKAK